MRTAPFTRPTLLAAVELLELHSQARFNQLVLRLELEADIPSTTDTSVAKKCGLLGRIVAQDAGKVLDTLEGRMTLGEATVREAAQVAQPGSPQAIHIAFVRGLARDGYVLVPDARAGSTSIRVALPVEVQLPATDDEVHRLLRHFFAASPHLGGSGHFVAVRTTSSRQRKINPIVRLEEHGRSLPCCLGCRAAQPLPRQMRSQEWDYPSTVRPTCHRRSV